MSGELASERWSPIQRVESVLISVLSLIDDAEVSSPANVDAGVMLRLQPDKYKERVKKDIEASKLDIPAGFTMPSQHTVYKQEVEDNNFSWSDSEEEDDFGGSDSDAEMKFDEDEDDGEHQADTGSSDDD